MNWRVLALLLLSLLSGCAVHPCNQYGVDVEPDAPITGRIVEEHRGTLQQVMAKCQSPFHVQYGCAIGVNEHEYVLWYTDDFVREHEACHALYEVGH